jgi:hypothetical protein
MDPQEDRQEWAAAFQRSTWGCAPAIGRALGLSARTVQQWGQTDSDKRSPGERLEILMRVALDARDHHDALAPLHLLANRFGYRLEPDVDGAPDEPAEAEHLARLASEAMIEAGEAVNAALAAQADGVISNDERDQVQRECDEAIEALVRLKRLMSRAR